MIDFIWRWRFLFNVDLKNDSCTSFEFEVNDDKLRTIVEKIYYFC